MKGREALCFRSFCNANIGICEVRTTRPRGDKMNSPHRLGSDISAAILILLVLIPLAAFSPFAIFVVWFLPIPLFVFFVHQFRWLPRLVSLVIGICLAFSGFGIAGFLFAYAIYILSQIMADSVCGTGNPYLVIVAGTFTFLMLFLVLLARIKWGGIHFYAELSKQLIQESASNNPLLRVEKANPHQLSALIINQLQLVLPGVLCIVAFLLSSVNFLIARCLTKSVRIRPPLLLPWNLPYGVIYVYIISLTFVLFGWLHDSTFWWHVLNSTILFAGFLVGIQGLAFVWRRLYGHRRAQIWMGLLLLATLVPIVRSIYILLGLIDSSNRTRKT